MALLGAIAACTALLAGPAFGVTISYLEDLREIHAFSVTRYGNPDPDVRDLTLQPSPPFSEFSTGISFPASSAWQVSVLGETGMFARGLASSYQDFNVFGGVGTSVFHIVFAVDEATPFTLEGFLGRQESLSDENAANTQLSLSSGGTVVYSIALPPNCIGPSCPNEPMTLPISASGVLAPGTYDLYIAATSDAGNTPGTATYDVGFRVPEPRTASLLLLSGLFAGLLCRASRKRDTRGVAKAPRVGSHGAGLERREAVHG